MPAAMRTPGLLAERIAPSAWAARSPFSPTLLGALAYGHRSPGAPADMVHADVLHGEPMVDAWFGRGPTQHGTCGVVDWRHDGDWLYGSVELPDTGVGSGLDAPAEQAYRDLFRTLGQTGFPHLQKVWNYLPGINADGGGLERYRQFNLGRHAAFQAAGYPAFEGAPAACALGTRRGPFCVRFIAGRQAPLPVENPRQVSAYRYPAAYGPRSPSFSRAALVQAAPDRTLLLISGTASIVGHESVHVGDVRAQARETLANLQAVVGAAHERTSARFALPQLACVVYVRHAADVDAVRSVFEEQVGATSHAARTAVYLGADVCRADLLVEIEAHASAEGEVRR